ncbi:MAG: DUF2378 family protein [Thermomicrobiales bacterium]|nr:DUF2378 family protein [Thermomicrobiales bacterium]
MLRMRFNTGSNDPEQDCEPAGVPYAWNQNCAQRAADRAEPQRPADAAPRLPGDRFVDHFRRSAVAGAGRSGLSARSPGRGIGHVPERHRRSDDGGRNRADRSRRQPLLSGRSVARFHQHRRRNDARHRRLPGTGIRPDGYR